MTKSSIGITKRRKPWLAALLSLGTTGLGQFYNGQWRKGLVFLGMEGALGSLVMLGMGSFAGLCVTVGLLIAANLLIAAEAYRTALHLSEYTVGPVNRWWIYALVIVANLTLGGTLNMATKARFYQTYKIPSGSMLQTLRIGDHFMAETLDEEDVIRRGDIVIFLQEDVDRYMVKRVIGLPGETIAMRGKTVFINGTELKEPYVRHTSKSTVLVRDSFPPRKLNPNDYFVMGDNREKSFDSRWLGPVRRTAIKARAKYLYFPGEPGSEEWFERLGMDVR